MLLTGLDASTRYIFEVAPADEAGNTVVDDNAAAYYAFANKSGRNPSAISAKLFLREPFV